MPNTEDRTKTVADLGRAKKLQYPGDYDSIPDIELGVQFQSENPGKYDEYIDVKSDSYEGGNRNKSVARSIVSKTIQKGEKVLGVAADPTSRHILGPLARKLPISEEAKTKIKALESGDSNVLYGSDIVEQMLPGIFNAQPTDSPTIALGRIGARVGIDVLTDPLSYAGLGMLTKYGTVLRSLKEAIIANKSIKLTSKIAMQIAKLEGVPKPTVNLINKYKKIAAKSGGSFSQEITKGERSLLSVTDPLNIGPVSDKLALTGKVAGMVVKPLSLLRRGEIGAKIEMGIRDLLSTSTGNPDYDLIRAKYKDLTEYRMGLKIDDGKQLNSAIEEVTRATGKPRDVINREISSLIESVKPTIVKGSKVSIQNFESLPNIMYHGSFESKGIRNKALPTYTEDFNIHVGTKKAALERLNNTRAGIRQGKPGGENLIPVQVNLKKPYGSIDNPITEQEIYKTYDTWRKASRELQAKGYDGVYYTNLVEDPNSISALVFKRKSLKTFPEYAKEVKKISIKTIKSKYNKDILQNLEAHYTDKLVDAQVGLKNAHRAGDAKLVDQYAKQVVEYNSELNKLTGKYTPPPSLDPQLDKIVNTVKEGYARQILDEQTSGRHAVPLLADIEYLTHTMVPDARKALTDKMLAEGKLPPVLSQKELSEKLANDMHRQFVEIKPIVVDAWKQAGLITGKQAKVIKGKEGLKQLWDMLQEGTITAEQYTDVVHTLPIEEVHKLSAEGKLSKTFGDYKGDIFHTDPVYSSTIRGVRGEIARTATEFFSEVKARGLAVEDHKAPAGWVNVRQGELKGFKVPKEIAKSLDKWNSFETKPQVLGDVLKLYDKFHSLTKIWTLAPFPAYHTMNAVGNFWNNFLAGVVNPRAYQEALMTQINKVDPRYRKISFHDVFGTLWNNEKLTEEMKKLGVTGRGQYAADVQKTIQQSLESGKFLTLSSRSHFLRTGIRAGQFVEDNARAAHFIDRLRKGDTAEQAAISVKKYLFDYGELSDFERSVLNRGFFFYTWTRKNIPLQLHSLVTTPAKFSLPYKVKHEIEKAVPEAPEKYLAEWTKENFPIRIKYDSKTKNYEYFMLNRWLPAADLVKVAHLHEIALQMVSPLPKEILQQIVNQDFYLKAPIQTKQDPGEKKKFIKMNLPVRLVHGMKLVRLLNEVDKLTKEDATMYSKMLGILTGKNYTFDPKQAFIGNKKKVDEDIKVLTARMYSEGMKGNQKEAKRIAALIGEKYKEY